ncbi:MAG: hypothetical protein ABGZ17_17800, partial [Planctomycetaceae bacterium]
MLRNRFRSFSAMGMFLRHSRRFRFTLCGSLLLAVSFVGGCSNSDSNSGGETQSDADENLWANVRLQKNEDGQVVTVEIERAADIRALLATL